MLAPRSSSIVPVAVAIPVLTETWDVGHSHHYFMNRSLSSVNTLSWLGDIQFQFCYTRFFLLIAVLMSVRMFNPPLLLFLFHFSTPPLAASLITNLISNYSLFIFRYIPESTVYCLPSRFVKHIRKVQKLNWMLVSILASRENQRILK
jgi:hypothetical protein